MRLTGTATFRLVDKLKGVQIKTEHTGRKSGKISLSISTR